MSPAVTADVLGEVARRTGRDFVAERGGTHPEDIADAIVAAVRAAAVAVTVINEERT